MLYAVHAYENIYGGLHGIEEFEVIEAETLKEAENYGLEMSYNVIDSYSDIMADFEQDAVYNGYEEGTEEYDEFIEESINEDTAFEVFPIVVETNKSLEELTNEYFNSPNEFVEEYCGIDN